MLRGYINDLKNEFDGYNRNTLFKDMMAGLTVAAVALPLALAFGVGSGSTAAAGLITAIIAGFIIGALSGASFQISGPTGAMTAILITLVHTHGIQGVFIATFMAGIMLVIAGIFRFGRLIYFIPSSVITGFTSGIAIIIALGQLDNFFGVKSEGQLAISKLISYFQLGFNPDIPTMLIGLLVIAIMVFWPKRLNSILPSSLASLLIILIINYFLKLDIATVGEIPKTLILPDRLSLINVSLAQYGDVIIPALSIAALAMIESLLCGAAGSRLSDNKHFDGDRELVAQGVGNIIIPFFGGVPATAAIARTSVVIKAGGVTRLAGIFHAGALLLAVFLLAPVMSAIPLSALAGVLIVTAWRMNDWLNITYIFGHRLKSGIAEFLITLTATIVLDLTQAIVIGVAFSAILIVVRLADIDITISEIETKRLEEAGIDIPTVPQQIRIAYLTGTIFFTVVEQLRSQLSELDDTDILILSMRGVPAIDISGLQALNDLVLHLRGRGTTLLMTSVQPKVLTKLERGGVLKLIGRERIFDSAEYAIIYANNLYADQLASDSK